MSQRPRPSAIKESASVRKPLPLTGATLLLGAIDFATIEVWTKGGLVTSYLLFATKIATCRAPIAGRTPNPDDRCTLITV